MLLNNVAMPIMVLIILIIGCPEWIPPEMCTWNVGEHTDVYCFGMTLIEILTLRLPYS
jgi:serine/threonine protein kinase